MGEEKGKVKWFSNVKGYGFLQKEGDDKDIFVHYSSIQSDGYKRLDSDEEVTFEIIEGEKGPQAKNVIRLKKPPKTKKEETPKEKKVDAAPSKEENKEKVEEPKKETKESNKDTPAEAPKEEAKEEKTA